MTLWICAFILLTLLFRLVFGMVPAPPVRHVTMPIIAVPPANLPRTVSEWLQSPIPLAVECEQFMEPPGGAATVYNHAAMLMRISGRKSHAFD
jgi:hypothetical protein